MAELSPEDEARQARRAASEAESLERMKGERDANVKSAKASLAKAKDHVKAAEKNLEIALAERKELD